MVGYYDKLIVAVPTVLLVGILLSLLEPVDLHQGLAVGSFLATILLYEAIVRNPPVEPTPADVTASIIAGLGWFLTLWLYF